MEQMAYIREDRDHLKKELDKVSNSSGKMFEDGHYKGDKNSNYLSQTNKSRNSNNYRDNANDL